ncbi:expressed unknown protein [Seminavis robusta]|uniref:Uncharacterized protein n=1 Tax=Seminavis robusta TaxID=568900 RepID=A0A9N8HQA0_9STRA|nr:expressed unknown protein [Seminavis robusta]|eukprot:Sro965_g225640.1 n/a (226) ;mRNA; f:36961-37766
MPATKFPIGTLVTPKRKQLKPTAVQRKLLKRINGLERPISWNSRQIKSYAYPRRAKLTFAERLMFLLTEKGDWREYIHWQKLDEKNKTSSTHFILTSKCENASRDILFQNTFGISDFKRFHSKARNTDLQNNLCILEHKLMKSLRLRVKVNNIQLVRDSLNDYGVTLKMPDYSGDTDEEEDDDMPDGITRPLYKEKGEAKSNDSSATADNTAFIPTDDNNAGVAV